MSGIAAENGVGRLLGELLEERILRRLLRLLVSQIRPVTPSIFAGGAS